MADVGTDAAKLPIRLLDAGRVPFCVASDRIDAGLARAAVVARHYVADGKLVLRRAAGLDAVDDGDRIDVVTMAGLGARTIRGVLSPARLRRLGVERVVLQPQTEIRLVREWLREIDYGIVDERISRERGRDYVAIAAERGAVAASRWHQGDDEDDLLEAGPRLVESDDPLVRAHWTRELERLTRILHRARGPAHGSAARRRDLALRILGRLPG